MIILSEVCQLSGVRYLDSNALIGISGLRIGQEITIPGDVINNCCSEIMAAGTIFRCQDFNCTKLMQTTVFLDIFLQERPRISSVKFNGLKNSETQDLVEKINLPVGSQVTAYLLNNTEKIIKDHFVEKGFLNTTVDFIQKDDPDQPNNVILTV